MKKRTVALLLARGAFNGSSQPHVDLKYKALLPIHGVPMVDHVLRALQESVAEKIFVVQGADEGLEQVVDCHPKNVFINCDSNGSSYSHSLFSGLTKLADHYGPDGLQKIEIMLVPCDVPFVNGGNFNRLIAANDEKDTDVCVSLIRSELLKESYPERDFHGLYYSDLGENYCIQNFAFISGRILRAAFYGGKYTPEEFGHLLPYNLLTDFAATADYLVSFRQTYYQIPLILWELLWRLARKRYILQSLLMLGKLLRRRCTTQDCRRFIFLASGLSTDYIDSQEAEISFDIDRCEHIDALLGLRSPARMSIVSK
jgi:CTP:molybdopterin cytidylyltransferase MocA